MINRITFSCLTFFSLLFLVTWVSSLVLLILCTIEYAKNDPFECDQPLDKLLWISWSFWSFWFLLNFLSCFFTIINKNYLLTICISMKGLLGIVLWSFCVNVSFNTDTDHCPKDFLLLFKVYSSLMVFLSSMICSVAITWYFSLFFQSSSTDSTSTSSSDSSSSLLA